MWSPEVDCSNQYSCIFEITLEMVPKIALLDAKMFEIRESSATEQDVFLALNG